MSASIWFFIRKFYKLYHTADIRVQKGGSSSFCISSWVFRIMKSFTVQRRVDALNVTVFIPILDCKTIPLFPYFDLFCLLIYVLRVIVAPDDTQWHTHTHTHTHKQTLTNTHTLSVGHLWTRDQPISETHTWLHTTLTRDRRPCLWQDSNPQSQEASSRRPTP